jgi:WD40 repeat protein
VTRLASPPKQSDKWDGYYSLALSPDGRLLALGTADGAVQLWDVARRKKLGLRVGHTGPVYCVRFSPDGKTLASGGDDSVILLWDVARLKK